MGQVFRARDTKLNRDVAVKVLPDSLAGDRDRLARFDREAQVLASLNHPHIAHLYGVEEAGATRALIMELVEGPTLADVIAARTPGTERVGARSRDSEGSVRSRGGGAPHGLEIDDAVRIARQIAEALEVAHEHGIVHRDLKPANVKVRDDGVVKVLDFGLAKAFDPSSSSGADAANSPTFTAIGTQMGMILGTAAYMSPEQAKGKAVDKRADVWAFGVVLYEMLTGRALFPGENVSETLAHVILKDPDWAGLPTSTPGPIRDLLRRCLVRDPRNRLRDMGEARIALDEAQQTPAGPEVRSETSRSSRRREWILGALALSFMVTTIAALARSLMTPDPRPQTVRFEVFPPAGVTSYGTQLIALSPDGRHLAFSTTVPSRAVYIRSLDSSALRQVAGADSSSPLPPQFFWSRDSKYLGVFSDGKLRKVPI